MNNGRHILPNGWKNRDSHYRWSKEMSEREQRWRWWRVLGRLAHWALGFHQTLPCPCNAMPIKKKKANTHFLFLVTTES